MTRMAHVEAGSKEWGLLGFYTQSSTWAQRLQQATRERLEPRVLCRLGLSVLGRVGYDGKPRGPRILWLIGFHRRIDDCGTGKLTLRVTLSDPFLNFLENVCQVEV